MTDFIDNSQDAYHTARYSRVYLSDALVVADQWEEVPKLYCTSLRDVVAPGMSEAKLMWHCGDFAQDFDGELNVIRKPYNLNRVYVKLEILSHPPATVNAIGPVATVEPVVEFTWFGSIQFDEFSNILAGGNPPNTDQIFTAYGLMRDLETTIVDSAVLVNLAGDDIVRIPRGLTFNPSRYADRPGVGNRTVAPVDVDAGNTWLFENTMWDGTESEKPERWTAYTALDHLLIHHPPQEASGDGPVCTWEIDGADIPLTQDHPSSLIDWYDIADVATDRRSVKAIIDELIDRRRFVGWYVYGDDSGAEFVAKIKVYSFSIEEIELTGRNAKIAANSDLVPLSLLNKPEIVSLDVSNNETQRYDEILVEGERITTTFTAFEKTGYLVKGWTDEQETAYLDAASGESGYDDLTEPEQIARNTSVRTDDSLQDVFSRFVFDPDWHAAPDNGGLFYDDTNKYRITIDDAGLSTINSGNVYQVFDTTADYTADPWWSQGARVLPQLPVANDDVERYREPFCLFRVEEGDPSTISTDIWQYAENLNADGTRLYSVGLQVLPDELGVRLSVGRAGGQQMIAKDDWSSAAAVPSDVDPSDTDNNALHYDDMLVTIAVEWDRRAYHCESIMRANQTAPKRVRHVYVPDARLDIRLPGTVTGLAYNGTLDWDDNGSIIRDDREKLKDIGKAMAAWYGVKRQAMNLVYGKLTLKIRPPVDGTTNPDPVRLGSLVTKVGVNISRPDVNSPITGIAFDLDRQETTIQTTFYEGDFV